MTTASPATTSSIIYLQEEYTCIPVCSVKMRRFDKSQAESQGCCMEGKVCSQTKHFTRLELVYWIWTDCFVLQHTKNKYKGGGFKQMFTMSSERTLLGFIEGIAVGVVGGIAVTHLFSKILEFLQGNRQVDQAKEKSTIVCKCKQNKYISCTYHDLRLLRALAKNLPDEGQMVDFGLALSVDPNIQQACREDNPTKITEAVYRMLLRWYGDQDGLGLKSEGLKQLKYALKEIEKPNLVRSVIEKNFVERRRTSVK